MKIKLLLIMGIIATLLGSCSSSKGFTSVGVDKFESYIAQPGVQLVDVRTPSEYLEGHLEGAQNIDVKGDNFVEQAQARLDRRKPVAVYCRSGRRSAMAAQQLVKVGYKVTNLDGGIIDWQVAGKKTVK